MLGGQEPPGMQPRVVILWLASRCRARVATPFRSCPRSDIRVASYRDHVPTGSQARGHAEAGTPRHRGRGGPRRAQVLASPALPQRPLGFGPLSAPVPPAPVCPAGSVPSEHRRDLCLEWPRHGHRLPSRGRLASEFGPAASTRLSAQPAINVPQRKRRNMPTWKGSYCWGNVAAAGRLPNRAVAWPSTLPCWNVPQVRKGVKIVIDGAPPFA